MLCVWPGKQIINKFTSPLLCCDIANPRHHDLCLGQYRWSPNWFSHIYFSLAQSDLLNANEPVTSQVKILQWLPIALRMKNQLTSHPLQDSTHLALAQLTRLTCYSSWLLFPFRFLNRAFPICHRIFAFVHFFYQEGSPPPTPAAVPTPQETSS